MDISTGPSLVQHSTDTKSTSSVVSATSATRYHQPEKLRLTRTFETDLRIQRIDTATPTMKSRTALDSASVKSEQVTSLEKMAHRCELINGYDSSKFRFTTTLEVSPQASPTNRKNLTNIISNPNFDHNSARSSSSSYSITRGNHNHQRQSTSKNNDEFDAPTTTKSQKKRTSSSFSSSLRRLLTITFNRHSTQSTNLSASSNSRANPIQYNPRDNNKSLSNTIASDKENAMSANEHSHKGQDKSKLSKKGHKKRHTGQNTVNLTPNQHLTAGSEKRTKAYKVQRIPVASHIQDQEIPEGFSDISAVSNSASQNERPGRYEASKPGSSKQDISQIHSIGEIDGEKYIECPLCVLPVMESMTPNLVTCRHRVCLECMQRYITTEINNSRLNIKCPICPELIHPNIIRNILQNENYYLKYERFMLRRVLAAEPDARWCPAPDCGYVVLANGCASCPRLVCGREGCSTTFCYHCKQEWHPNQTCSAASIQRNKRQTNTFNTADLIEESTQSSSNRKSSKTSQRASSIRAEDIKECPVCSSRIIKMNDGSCNHMTCSICETEFCWLCMKEISDLHYFSPSGCTFWGKKPWSRKKKLLWQLGMLVGAPICIILIAGIAVPAIVIGIPVWAARKLNNRLERKSFSRYKKNAIITGGVLLSFIVSPIVSAVALAVGIPILLGYVYGVVPLSLCRSSSGCLSAAPSLEDLQQQFQSSRNIGVLTNDVTSIDTALSHKLGDPSIGETSLYMSNISLETNSIGHVTTVGREDRESASNAALAGSIISNVADDGSSTKALAGSIISKESGYTLVPAEVHSSNQDHTQRPGNSEQPLPAMKPIVKEERKPIEV